MQFWFIKTDIKTIEQRAEIVMKLVNDKEFFSNLRTLIKSLNGLDEIVTFSYHSLRKQYETVKATENKIQNVLNMKIILQTVQELNSLIQSSDSEAIKIFFEVFKKQK